MNLPHMLAYRVGREATLLYTFMLLQSGGSGVCESVHFAGCDANLTKDEKKRAIEELEREGLIEVVWKRVPVAEICGGYVYGSSMTARLFEFDPGKTIGRLSAPKWAELRETIFERDDYTCQYCGKRGGKLECDHIEPVSRGGTNEPGNLVTACRKCNREKRSKLLEEWRRASV